jgi:cytochrome c5
MMTTRKILAIAFLLVAGSAQAQQSPTTQCTEPRPQMCPQVYNPVCGVAADASKKTYGNGCSACADKAVVGHTPGPCS